MAQVPLPSTGQAPLLTRVIRAVLVLAILCGAAPATAQAQAAEAWTVTEGEVRVRCRMTVGGSFNAVTSEISGTLQRATPGDGAWTGELRVALGDIDTGIELRNDHLRDSYLEIARGPDFREAVLTDVVLREPLPAGNGRHETEFTGALTLHGVGQPVEGEVELRRRDGRLQVEAGFSLSLEAFEVPPPRYLGIGVRDEVEITVEFEVEG